MCIAKSKILWCVHLTGEMRAAFVWERAAFVWDAHKKGVPQLREKRASFAESCANPVHILLSICTFAARDISDAYA
jgi:hypothetical protein